MGFGTRYLNKLGTAHFQHLMSAPLLLSSFPLYSPRHTPFGFRAVLPLCDGKAQGPPSQLWGRTQQLGAGGVLYSKQGGPLGPICHLVVLFLRRLVVVVVAVCSGGTASPTRPEPTTLPSQPASQPPQIRARAISCGGVGGGVITKGPSLWACVGSATSAQLGYGAQAMVIPHLDA